MSALVFLPIGVAVAIFVGINIGGSGAGVSFGPVVGGKVLSNKMASLLMALFVLLGGVLVGPNVVETMGGRIIPSSYFTPLSSIIILSFIGIAILYGVFLKISVGTSQIAVGALVGIGVALSVLNWEIIGVISVWWVVSSIIAFLVSATIGRYFYDRIVRILNFQKQSRSKLAKLLVILVGCYMAFSYGASNVANAVAPLVGSGSLSIIPGVILGGLSIGVGAFLLGSRTVKTIGSDITNLSLEATLIVEVIGATIITLLSRAGIPASLTISLTMCVIGLGWGRATRRVSLKKEIGLERITEKDKRHIKEDNPKLYNLKIIRKIISTWMLTPLMAGFLTFVVFKSIFLLGFI